MTPNITVLQFSKCCWNKVSKYLHWQQFPSFVQSMPGGKISPGSRYIVKELIQLWQSFLVLMAFSENIARARLVPCELWSLHVTPIAQVISQWLCVMISIGLTDNVKVFVPHHLTGWLAGQPARWCGTKTFTLWFLRHHKCNKCQTLHDGTTTAATHGP